MKIAHKMMTSFLVVSTFVAVMGVGMVFFVVQGILQIMVVEHLSATVQSRGVHIETVVSGYKDDAAAVANEGAFRSAVDATKENTQAIEAANREIQAVLKVHANITNISILDKEGIVIASTCKQIGADEKDKEMFIKGMEGAYAGDIHFSRFIKSDVISVAAPILSNGQSAGIVDITFSAKEMQEIIADRTGLGATGEVSLENKDGYMMLSSLVRRTYRGDKRLGSHGFVQPMQWVLTADLSKKAVLDPPMLPLKIIMFMIIVAAPVLSGLIGFFISVPVIAGPLMKLRKGAKIIGAGNLDYKVRTEAKDEIGQLSRAFDKMINDLKKVVVSKNYVDNIVNSMADMLIVMKPNGNIEKANKAVLDNLGYDEEDLMGKDIRILLKEEEIALKGTKFEKLMEGATVKDYAVDFKAKDGKKIPVILSGSAIRATSCSHVGLSEECPTFQEKGRHCKDILRIVCVAKDIPGGRRREDNPDTKASEIEDRQI
jgi:PAS domain S-box-containing protein